MKRIFLIAGLGGFMAFAAHAQVIPERKNEGVTKETRTAKRGDVFQDLNLTQDQQGKLKTLNQESREQMQAIRNDNTLTDEQKKVKFEELRQSQKEKREAILTPEQNARVKARMQQMRGERQSGHKGKEIGKRDDKDKKDQGRRGLNGKDKNGLNKEAKGERGDWMKDLNLTAEQKVQMKYLNEDMRLKMQSIRDNVSLNQEKKRFAMQELQKEIQLKRRGILTAEQQAKWEAREKQMRAMRPESRTRNEKI